MKSSLARLFLAPVVIVASSLAFTASVTAAEDTLFLTERVSVSTDSGMRGFGPGTEVRKISGTGSAIKVKTIDSTILTVTSKQVTADADEGHRLGSADSDARRQADEAQAARKLTEPAEAPRPMLKFNPGAGGGASSGAASSSSVGGGQGLSGTSLDKGAEDAGVKVKPMRYPKRRSGKRR